MARAQYELCALFLLLISLNNLMEFPCSIFYYLVCGEIISTVRNSVKDHSELFHYYHYSPLHINFVS